MKDIERLREYAVLEDAETGAICQLLIKLYANRNLFIGFHLSSYLIYEMEKQLENFERNSKITRDENGYKKLEWT